MNSDHPAPGRLPLQGVRIVDLTTVMFGPYASQFLAEFGADVIKVEAPGGDSTRRTGPARTAHMAAAFLNLNKNKRSIVLDLKTEAARKALGRLIADADVLMHNIRPQKLASLGLEPAALKQKHPRLIVASLNGFSHDGPYGGKPAYDDVIQGMCGISDLMSRVNGEMRYLPTAAADKVAGLMASQAILAALAGRAASSCGHHIEIPMFEVMVGFTLVEHWGGQTFIPPQGPSGYSRVLARSRRPYPTRDGHVCLIPYTDEHWRRFFARVGRTDLIADPRFTDIAARTKNIEALLELVGGFLTDKTTAEWLAIFEEIDVPAAPVIAIDDLPDDPHLKAVGLFKEIENGDGAGNITLPGNGIRFDGEAASLRAPPHLGQHTRELLRHACYSEEQIDALIATGAARQFNEVTT